MGKDFTPRMSSASGSRYDMDAMSGGFIGLTDSDPVTPREFEVPNVPDRWAEGVVEVIRTEGFERTYSARFFDGTSVQGKSPLRAFLKAREYSDEKMNHFRWHIYQRTRWTLGATLGPRVHAKRDSPAPEFPAIGLSHNPRDCEADAFGHTDTEWWYRGRDLTTNIHEIHAAHPTHENAYLDFFLCGPCALGILQYEGDITGPGAWEYR